METAWALLPPILAIGLALLTKEVYLSVFAGIAGAALLYTRFDIPAAVSLLLTVLQEQIAANFFILLFLVLLGMLAALMNDSGAAGAYGRWAIKRIHTPRSAMAATSLLGAVIFVDDYFNCLTVGTVMRPITDACRVSRAKLAYIIDATAAPVCILAPISSWGAAVSASLPQHGDCNGFELFLQCIPFNYYALFTLFLLAFLVISGRDFGKMHRLDMCTRETETQRIHVHNRGNGLGSADQKKWYAAQETMRPHNGIARVFDLLVPIIALIAGCVMAMLYTGGFFQGKSMQEAFAASNAAQSMVVGAFGALVTAFVLYVPRRIIRFSEFMQALVQGFQTMVPAILILSLAWTLGGILSDTYLNLGGYVSHVIVTLSLPMQMFPAILFAAAAGLSFATGTSWGTFAILIPIAAAASGVQTDALILSVSAVLSGAVCGDHMSPISDTTILASTGARCDHLLHVSTQLPYAIVAAICGLIGHLIAGLTNNGWLGLAIGFVALFLILLFCSSHGIGTGRAGINRMPVKSKNGGQK